MTVSKLRILERDRFGARLRRAAECSHSTAGGQLVAARLFDGLSWHVGGHSSHTGLRSLNGYRLRELCAAMPVLFTPLYILVSLSGYNIQFCNFTRGSVQPLSNVALFLHSHLRSHVHLIMARCRS